MLKPSSVGPAMPSQDFSVLVPPADEVVAHGRLGSWLESAGRGMRPDMITMAKGIAGGCDPSAPP